MSLSICCSLRLIDDNTLIANFTIDTYKCKAVFYLGKKLAIHTDLSIQERSVHEIFYEEIIAAANRFECCFILKDHAKHLGLDISVIDSSECN